MIDWSVSHCDHPDSSSEIYSSLCEFFDFLRLAPSAIAGSCEDTMSRFLAYRPLIVMSALTSLVLFGVFAS